jgi:hypothetical protein
MKKSIRHPSQDIFFCSAFSTQIDVSGKATHVLQSFGRVGAEPPPDAIAQLDLSEVASLFAGRSGEEVSGVCRGAERPPVKIKLPGLP